MPKQMHLALDVSWTQVESAWRMPGSWVGRHYPDVGLFEDIARIAERGLFDMIFFGDGSGIPNTWEGGIDAAVRRGVAWPRLDMSPWITAMSRVTSHVGFGLTYASTFMHPFYVARLLNSLDHITNGRIAFNVISSQRRSDYENYGYDELIDHGERYDRMEEFIEVCKALWSSVDADAFVWDRLNGLVADPAKVRPINHVGRFFKVKGPLSVVPSPQGHPVLVQAGGSQARDMGRGRVCRSRIRRRQGHPADGAAARATWMRRCANAAGTRNRSASSGPPRSSSARPRTRPKACARVDRRRADGGRRGLAVAQYRVRHVDACRRASRCAN